MTAIALALVYLTLEVRTIFHGPVLRGQAVTDAEDYTYSAVWLAFGVALLLAGIALKSQPARFASAAVVILTVVKVFLHDLAGVQGVYKALVLHLSRACADGDRLALSAAAVPAAAAAQRAAATAGLQIADRAMNEITYGVVPVETLLQYDGLTFLRGLIDGTFPGAADHADARLHAVGGRSWPRGVHRRAAGASLQPDRHGAWRLCDDAARFRARLRDPFHARQGREPTPRSKSR